MDDIMNNWQNYLLNECFDKNNFPEVSKEYRYHPNLKRFMTYEELEIDTIQRNGAIAATTLSLLFKPKVVVEFGVDLGWTALLLSKLNPQAEVHGVDHREMTWFDRDFPIGYACKLHKVQNHTLHVPMNCWDFDMTGKVDLCFIDGAHDYQGVFDDTWRAWHNRNKTQDWCIAFDDYHPSNAGLVKAIDEFVKMSGFKLQKIASWVWIGTKEVTEQELSNV